MCFLAVGTVGCGERADYTHDELHVMPPSVTALVLAMHTPTASTVSSHCPHASHWAGAHDPDVALLKL